METFHVSLNLKSFCLQRLDYAIQGLSACFSFAWTFARKYGLRRDLLHVKLAWQIMCKRALRFFDSKRVSSVKIDIFIFSARAIVYSISIIKYVDISCTNHFSFSPCNTLGRGHLLDSFWHCQWFAGGQVGACRGHHANFSNWTRSIYCQLLSCRRVQDTRS